MVKARGEQDLAVAVQLPVAGSYSSAARFSQTDVLAAGHQHLPVRQQRRRVYSACSGEAAGRRPHPGRRIV